MATTDLDLLPDLTMWYLLRVCRRPVLPWDTVDKSINPCEPLFKLVLRHWAVWTDQLIRK